MQAVELRGVGLDNLVIAERPAPVPGAGEVLVEVHHASLNYRDLAIARGEYPAGRPLPVVLGSDAAGTVRALGPGCVRARLGERVVVSYAVDWVSGEPETSRLVRRLGGPLDGALAQLVVVPEHALVPLPEELGFSEAATLPVAGVTAWRGLFRVARVTPGDFVLVFGTGGVSTFAVQLASAAGARPIVVGGDTAKLERARSLGAWATVDRRAELAWEDRVLALTEGRGVDVAVDVVGGESTARGAEAMRAGGTLLLVGFLGGPELRLDVRALLRRCLRLEALSAGGSRDDLEDLVRAIAARRIRPVIDRAFPLHEVRDALAHLAAGAHFGKVVVDVRSQPS